MSTALKRYTVDEFLAFEETSEVKHEYFDGEVFAMAGGTVWHNLIAGNIVRHVGNLLADRGCLVLPSDMMVRCPTGLRTYPDVTVVCEEPEFEDPDKPRVLLNPLIAIEILSDTTEAYDRGRKFDNYVTIPSLEEYVLVAQDRKHVDHFAKQSDGRWLLTQCGVNCQTVEMPSLDCSLSMAEIYANVEFPKPEAAKQSPASADG